MGASTEDLQCRPARMGRRRGGRGVAARAGAAALAAVLVGSAAAVVGAGAVAGATAGASGATYVALGDSYTSGAGILPLAPTAPIDCLQSTRSYPWLVAASLGLTLRDPSCSGATTSDFTTAQYPDQPPQDDALTPTTAAVTVGIGGNDNNVFVGSLVACASLDAADAANIGSPCKDVYGSYFADEVRSDAPVISAALARIHTLAPKARITVVGYLDILPQSGNCYPQVPLTTGDVAYLNQLEKTLNGMLASQAAANDDTFVDTFTPSIGHDACKAPGVRWVEPPIPTTDAAPVHPNAAGEAEDAALVGAALARQGF